MVRKCFVTNFNAENKVKTFRLLQNLEERIAKEVDNGSSQVRHSIFSRHYFLWETPTERLPYHHRLWKVTSP